MKIKCFKVKREAYKVVGSCQVFYNNQGTPKYDRVRNCDKRENDKPFFIYHAQNLPYIISKLGIEAVNTGQKEGQIAEVNIDQQNLENSSELYVARDVSFKPTFKFHSEKSLPSFCANLL